VTLYSGSSCYTAVILNNEHGEIERLNLEGAVDFIIEKKRIILAVICVLLVTIGAFLYSYGWQLTVNAPESSAPAIEEPVQFC